MNLSCARSTYLIKKKNDSCQTVSLRLYKISSEGWREAGALLDASFLFYIQFVYSEEIPHKTLNILSRDDIDKKENDAIISANDSHIGGRLMSIYNTKQRRALLAFLEEHPDELLTARQMADALAEKQISLSAVYRNLAQLEAEEKVRRSAKSGSHEAFYQYLDAKGCKGALHMSCVKCGKTFHMADSNAALFAKHLAQNEQFTLDVADTILYGICSDCKGK